MHLKISFWSPSPKSVSHQLPPPPFLTLFSLRPASMSPFSPPGMKQQNRSVCPNLPGTVYCLREPSEQTEAAITQGLWRPACCGTEGDRSEISQQLDPDMGYKGQFKRLTDRQKVSSSKLCPLFHPPSSLEWIFQLGTVMLRCQELPLIGCQLETFDRRWRRSQSLNWIEEVETFQICRQ